jgi:hypothetical protein
VWAAVRLGADARRDRERDDHERRKQQQGDAAHAADRTHTPYMRVFSASTFATNGFVML